MIFRWETEDERMLRFIGIPAKRKLEWLYEMNKFLNKFSSAKVRKIREKLREF